MERFSASVHVDGALFREDVRGSIAHARMLARQGILTPARGEQLVKALEQVAHELETGALELDPALEDVHTNVERRLFALVGPLAGKLHTGRSRNDQIATDFVLWLRAQSIELRGALAELRGALVERAAREVDVVLPGYTHLQRAQPVRLAHHWLAHYEALTRDDGRLADARARMSRSPLGAGALAGSTLPIERESTAARARLRRTRAQQPRRGVGARRGARALVRARDPDGAPVAASARSSCCGARRSSASSSSTTRSPPARA